METSAWWGREEGEVSHIVVAGMETSAEGEGVGIRAPLTEAAGMETSAAREMEGPITSVEDPGRSERRKK